MARHIGFLHHLNRFGPHRRYGPMSASAARAYCRRLAQSHYENFSVASLLLPRRLLVHFHNVYAFCRWADDLGDETGRGRHALELLRWWREELLDCYAGRAHHPVMVALSETIDKFQIPAEPFLDLIYAFEQDQLIKTYRTMPQLLEYCRYSANPVGRLVLHLCCSFDPRRAELSDCICTALQLTNFWQDVARDFAIGRVYLPASERRRFGYADADLREKQYNTRFADLLAYLVQHTREMFLRGSALVGMMPRFAQADVELFVNGGLSVLRKIERQEYNVWRRRPVLTKAEKLMLTAGVAGKRLLAGI